MQRGCPSAMIVCEPERACAGKVLRAHARSWKIRKTTYLSWHTKKAAGNGECNSKRRQINPLELEPAMLFAGFNLLWGGGGLLPQTLQLPTKTLAIVLVCCSVIIYIYIYIHVYISIVQAV